MLVISAVVVAIGLKSRDGAGTTAKRAGAISAARVVGDAVDDFRKDHAGRAPVLGNTADWPTNSLANRNRGPINTYTGRPYLRARSVEAFDSRIARVVGPGGTAPDPVRYLLQYSISPGRPGGWAIVVRDKRGTAAPCYLIGGSMPIPSGAGAPC